MPRTKHVLIFVLVLAVMLLSFLVYRFVSTRSGALSSETAVQFVSSETLVSVIEKPEVNKKSIRDAVLARLGSIEHSASVSEANDNAADIDEDVLSESDSENTGRISTSPERGALFLCNQKSDITASTGGRVKVDGAVIWKPEVSIVVAEGARVIAANGIPAHPVGMFPAGPKDDAYEIHGATSGVRIGTVSAQLPQFPTIQTPACVPEGIIGVAINGVPLYGSFEEGTDSWQGGAFDVCGGHTDDFGNYHYHTESRCLFDSNYEGGQSTLLGYARDGFGIFSNIEQGTSVNNSDLDSCHGHTHTIPWDGELITMYHYHFTDEFPYTVGCFLGSPTEIEVGG